MIRKIALIFGAGVSVIVGAFALLLHISAGAMCGNQPLARVPSPDRQLDAVLFERDCGATTGFSTQVTVLAHGSELPNEPGNIGAVDDNHGAVPQGPGGGPELKLAWDGRRELVVYHHRKARVYERNSRDDVRVKFAAFN